VVVETTLVLLEVTDFELEVTDFELEVAGFELEVVDFELDVADFELEVAGFELDVVLVTKDELLETLLTDKELDVTLVKVPDPEIKDVCVEVAAQTNWLCPISHAPLILKGPQTNALIAFRFAFPNELSGTVKVWVAPVTPVRVVR
jgi:hypothetical protein